ncbi:F200B protein, partial [Polyodon spathula]|nr:F200B protein [Polyodon spathula]
MIGTIFDEKTAEKLKSIPLTDNLQSAIFCSGMGAVHTHLLYHTEIRWLSQDRVPTQVYELRDEILAAMSDNFSCYFPAQSFGNLKKRRWVKNPFVFKSPHSIMELNLTPEQESELLQLSSDNTLKTHHKSSRVASFWISISKEYPVLSRISVLLLLPFITTCMCELGFTALTRFKTNERS